MEDLRVFEALEINSHKGKYRVQLQSMIVFDRLNDELLQTSHFIIDKNIAELYGEQLKKILSAPSVLLIDATENNKSLEQFPAYIEHLVKNKIRCNHRLIAIGGGIIQDITCFIAATLLRGVDWWFYPTTLLAQADSCIGSKSSVNCSGVKNILGTFTPPKQVYIFTEFLNTLTKKEIQSGIGEMLKVHAIDHATAFDAIANDYQKLLSDQNILLSYLRRSLEIKKNIIEQDEFDQDIRNIMNYGHTFGHAIESATAYQIPHGIAVTIGMDMANYIAYQYDFCKKSHFDRMHSTLKLNYTDFIHYPIPLELFINAISKDKKNMGKNKISVIFPDKKSRIVKSCVENNVLFQKRCEEYFNLIRLL